MSLDILSLGLGSLITSVVFLVISFYTKKDNVLTSVDKDIQKIQTLTLQRLEVEKELRSAQDKITASQNVGVVIQSTTQTNDNKSPS